MLPDIYTSDLQKTFSIDRLVLDIKVPFIFTLDEELETRLSTFMYRSGNSNKARVVTEMAVDTLSGKTKTRSTPRTFEDEKLYPPARASNKPRPFFIHHVVQHLCTPKEFKDFDPKGEVIRTGALSTSLDDASVHNNLNGLYTVYTAQRYGLEIKTQGVVIRARRMLNLNKLGRDLFKSLDLIDPRAKKAIYRHGTNLIDPTALKKPWSASMLQEAFILAGNHLAEEYLSVLDQLGLGNVIGTSLSPHEKAKAPSYPVYRPSEQEGVFPLQPSHCQIGVPELEFGLDVAVADVERAFDKGYEALNPKCFGKPELNNNARFTKAFLRKQTDKNRPDSFKVYTKGNNLLRLEVQTNQEHFRSRVSKQLPKARFSNNLNPHFEPCLQFQDIKQQIIEDMEGDVTENDMYLGPDELPFTGWDILLEVFKLYQKDVQDVCDAIMHAKDDSSIQPDQQAMRTNAIRLYRYAVSRRTPHHIDCMNEIFANLETNGRLVHDKELKREIEDLRKMGFLANENGNRKAPNVITPKFKGCLEFLNNKGLLPIPREVAIS